MKLLAPNGKKSNLTPEQYRLVRTPAFKKWFGDWENSPKTASKVVDENGEPLVCYHATNNEFDEFSYEKVDEGSGAFANIGFYFTSYKQYKSSSIYGKIIKKVFLNLRNPFITGINIYKDDASKSLTKNQIIKLIGNRNTISDFYNKEKIIKRVTEKTKKTIDYITFYESYSVENQLKWIWEAFFSNEDIEVFQKEVMKATKYDGSFIVNNDYYVAFHPSQIKLADGTNTTFDGNNPDIRYDNGGEVLLAPNGKPTNLAPEQYRIVRTPEFKAWFGDWENSPENASKIVDNNGEPLICFHGSNQSFNEFSHEAIGSSNDMGFYGRGFYFTFQKEEKWMKFAIGEAGYYGKIVKPYFIKALNPFIFGELKQYKGVNINFQGTQSLVFLSNIAKKFPQLAEKITLDKKIYNSITKENEITQVPISILPDLIDKYSKDLKIIEVHDNKGETKINGYLKSKTKEVFYDNTESGGTKGSYLDFDTLSYGIDNNNKKESIEILLIEAAFEKYDGIEVKYNPEGYMTRNPEITEEIKKNHDCIMQGETGDELVVFENNRMKLADVTNITFDSSNPDIRFKDGGNVSKLPKEFNSNENLNKEDMPYSLIKELGESGIYEYTEKVSYKKRGNFNDGNKSFYKSIKKYAVFKIQNGELKKIRTNINKKSEAVKILKDNSNNNVIFSDGGTTKGLIEVKPNRYLYHSSNTFFRDKIKNEGLVVKGYSETWLGDTEIEGEVIFATNSSNREDWFDSTYDNDIYEIDTNLIKNKWYKDPNFLQKTYHHIITFENIPLKAIKLIYKGSQEDTKYFTSKEAKKVIHASNPNIKYKDGGQIKDLLSAQEVEDKLGRDLHWWNDDVVFIGGQKYKKVYLRPEYKRVIE